MKKLILLFVAVFFACESDTDGSNGSFSESGQGGSLARFTILNDYLYTVDNQNLNVFNIQNFTNPTLVNEVGIGFDIETLFAYRNYLYIGSRTGMYIYSVNNPEFPEQLASVDHFTACDPVVANENFAFVTLHSNVGCGNELNQLEIYDVTDVTDPILVSIRQLVNPIGLGLYGDYLFVCDDDVKVFDVSDPENSTLVTSIDRNTFDVIIKDNLLILIGENGLYQYSLNPNDIEDIQHLSSLTL